MNDVAAAAGVSQSTVSRVLNDAPARIDVSEKTRQRVLEVARDLGYDPHPIARALRGAPTMQLGAIVRDITDPFFGGAIEALSFAAKEEGYSVVLGHARAKADDALALRAVLEARQCDAIVLLGDFRDERRLVEDLRNANTPVVGLWYGSGPGRSFPTVGVDNRAGTLAALEHLRELGHRRIAFVGAESLGDMQERRAAYSDFLAKAGIDVPGGYTCLVSNTIAGGVQAFSDLSAQIHPPTAVMAATDTLAIAINHAAHERGVAVPERLSIVGFDDIPLAVAMVPSLTTVRMPINEIMVAGVRLAVGADRWRPDDGNDAPSVVFQPKLIVRASTAAAPTD
jgi:DNA-binding LacI/PurR family transcriptional regulator